MSLIIPFRSRNQALRLDRELNARNQTSVLINTPRALSRSCGLSVKTLAPFDLAFTLIRNLELNTLIGVFSTQNDAYIRLYP